MARAHLYRPVTDVEGNIVPLTTITLYEAASDQLLQQTIYSDPISTMTPRDNPWVTSDGYIDVYLDLPQTVRIGTRTQGGDETFIDNISVLPAPENMVWAKEGFVITNDQTEGFFLQSGAPGVAAWVAADDIIEGKPTPLTTAKDYDWTGSILDDAVVIDAAGTEITPTYVDVTGDSKPTGWTFATALRLPTTGVFTVRIPTVDFPEPGTLTFLYKTVGTASTCASLRADLDTNLASVTTPVVSDTLGTWRIGYLDKIPSGTHRLTINHVPGTDLASYVLIGPVLVHYGNNIPEHDHAGVATDSTRLGPGSTADHVGATVVGSLAESQGEHAVVYGYQAEAGLDAVAIGWAALASDDAVAVGAHAGGQQATGWVAVGESATVGSLGAQAVVLGAAASAAGASSVALGAAAVAGGTESLALGPAAHTAGLRSIALGQGASAPYDYSVAIGPGVVTLATHEARIGDADTEVIIPGPLRMVGTDTTIGGPASQVGFFGSAGTTRPTVSGSRGGNTVLRDLLIYLDSIGLIHNSSTS